MNYKGYRNKHNSNNHNKNLQYIIKIAPKEILNSLYRNIPLIEKREKRTQ